MRPYNLHKEQDGKYIQPTLAQANVIQPSPLALLAATCSKIGQTLQEDTQSFSQGKSGVVTLTKSCAQQPKSSAFVYLDRSVEQHKVSSPVAPGSLQAPYFKIKHEETVDYNQNYEGVHICPNVIQESRMVDSQRSSRGLNASSCGHRQKLYPPSCGHSVESSTEYYSPSPLPSCEHSSRNTRFQPQQQHQSQQQQGYSPSPSADQFNMPSQSFFGQNLSVSQTSSCAYENPAFQGSALANLPLVTPVCSVPEIQSTQQQQQQTGFGSQPDKQIDFPVTSWASQERDSREQDSVDVNKSSCMMFDRYESSNQLRHIPHQGQLPISRHSLSHVNTPVPPPLTPSTPGPCSQQYFPSPQQNLSPVHSMHTSPQSMHQASSQSLQHQMQQFSGFPPSPVEVKPEPYLQHPQTFRQPGQHSGSMYPVSPMADHSSNMFPQHVMHHSHQQQQKWRQQQQMPGMHQHPSDQVGDMMTADSMNMRMHGVAPGDGSGMTMNDYCGTCTPPPTQMHMPQPGMLPGVGHPPPEMQGQAMSEYQYQQQQMFYARDNRRPRRIACTCPNCRDGENKMVTTKDGKQRKLHVCHVPGCGKVYGKTSHLRAHLRWHAGERPFACSWLFCNKRFTRSDELQRHRRTHTGDKRFQCRTCLKKFMRSDHLSKHMKTHLVQPKTSKAKDEAEVTTTTTTTADGTSTPSSQSETSDLGAQLKEVLSDSSSIPVTTS